MGSDVAVGQMEEMLRQRDVCVYRGVFTKT